MKDSVKEEYAQKTIDFVKSLDANISDTERRRVLSFAYKTFNKTLVANAQPAKKQSHKKKK